MSHFQQEVGLDTEVTDILNGVVLETLLLRLCKSLVSSKTEFASLYNFFLPQESQLAE
jgi:hypothetical protein